MKKIVSVVSMLLALSVIGMSNEGHTNYIADASELETTLKSKVVYEENFESYALDSSGMDVVYPDKHLLWFASAPGGYADAYVKEHNDSHAMEYTVITTDDGGYTKFGGIGTEENNNLANLVIGEKYTLSMDISLTSTATNGFFYIEYQNQNWTGVKIDSTNTMHVLGTGTTLSPSYINGHLEFSFIAGLKNGKNSYITFVGENLDVADTVVIDNISITLSNSSSLYDFDFENYEVGTAATTSSSNIGNVWNGGFDKVEIASDGTNKYLKATSASKNGDAWPLFYINNLWNMKSGTSYRMTFDVITNNSIEFYLGYNAGYPKPSATYNSTSYVGKTADQKYILDGSFDGTHLTFDFVPNTNITLNTDWPQVAIIIKHNADVEFAIDNVKVYELAKTSKSFTLDTTNAKLSYCLNETLDLSNVKGNLTRTNADVRIVNSDEIVFDTASLDLTAIGNYEITGYIVDEFGIKFSDTLTVTITDHAYENACDADCNLCGTTRTPSDHVYENACDKTCNVCGETRTPSDHVYENTCDTTCDVCGEVREITHAYDNDCDATCNVCGETRTVGDHVYDNTCDTTCNICGAERTITHTYDNECDVDCNVCGEIREVGDHVYGDDNLCIHCGNEKPISSGCGKTGMNIVYILSLVTLLGVVILKKKS